MTEAPTTEKTGTSRTSAAWAKGVTDGKRALRQHEDAHWVIGKIAAELIPVVNGDKSKEVRRRVDALAIDLGMNPETLNTWRLTYAYFGGPIQPEDLPAGNPSTFPWKVYKDVKNHYGKGKEKNAIEFLRKLERRNPGVRWTHDEVMAQLKPATTHARHTTDKVIARNLSALEENISKMKLSVAVKKEANAKLKELREILGHGSSAASSTVAAS